MGVKTDSISCPNCGSNDIYEDDKGIFHCNSCNSKFLVNLENNIIEQIEKLKQSLKNPEKEFTLGIATKIKFSEEEFKKKVFETLRDDSSVPSYVFNELELGEIKIIEIPVIHASGHADVNYSRLIGFDRIETHTEFKKYKDISGNEHIDAYEVNETKTDWHPDNGMLSGDGASIYYNSSEDNFPILNTISNLEDEDLEELPKKVLSEYSVNNDAINRIKRDIISHVYYRNITSSGDHQKNESYNGRATIDKSMLIIAKIYVTEITLRNEKILIYSPAYSRLRVNYMGDFPAEDDQTDFENKVIELENEKKALMKKPNTISILLFILAGILFTLLIVLGSNLNIIALSILAFILPIIPIVLAIIFKMKAKDISIQYKVKVDKLDEERDTRIQNTKNEGYKNFYND